MKMEAHEKEHLKAIRKYLPECTVLLRSDGSFPLPGPGEIAAFGNGVRHTIKGGTGSGNVNSHFVINVEEGLEKAGFIITSKKWLDSYDEILKKAQKDFKLSIYKSSLKKLSIPVMEGFGKTMPEPEYALPLKGSGEAAIYVLSRICGEGSDRKAVKGDLLLTDTEIRDIQALQRSYKYFMLVLNTGGPVDLSPLHDVKNILFLSQLGVDTGYILASILLGRMYPSGKLTTSWAAPKDFSDIGEFGNLDDTCYNEGIYVGYRYYDAVGKTPLFPFGFGLGYTDFELGNESVTLDGELVTVSVEVENTGSFNGKETVQIYVSRPETKLDHPVKELIAYAKTGELKPGEKETVTISFPIQDAVSYDPESAAWILEAGDYVLRAGTSSADTSPLCILHVEEEFRVLQVKNAFGDPGFTDWKPAERPAEELPDGLEILDVDLSALSTQTVAYDYAEEVDPVVEAMTDEELAYLSIGHFSDGGGLQSIIGNAAQDVAGAAGETSTRFRDRGIGALIMADGPAGLRLTKDYFLDENGVPQGIGSPLPEDMVKILPAFVETIMENSSRRKVDQNTEILHQYCTAVPIGTAIAQSWNLNIPEIMGDIIGTEMEKYGIHLWLAPALNIHRNVLCGRNFEYYSEDPLISGLVAAAITKGVQKHPACGTTIKHFAANSQERNRLANNSVVSERALREIYLKGFEICIRDSQPKAIMTSYNLINGTHTSERRDLNIDVLRSEFGFKGLNMTDWVIAAMAERGHAHDTAVCWKTLKAGGSIYMPGSKDDFNGVMKALEDGSMTRSELEQSAACVYNTVKEFGL